MAEISAKFSRQNFANAAAKFNDPNFRQKFGQIEKLRKVLTWKAFKSSSYFV